MTNLYRGINSQQRVLTRCIAHTRACFSFLLSLLLCALLLSCANTATTKSTRGNEIKFTFNFSANVDFSNYDYYLIFADSTNLKVEIIQPNFYFFAPGQNVDPVKAERQSFTDNNESTEYFAYYYPTYFSSWTDYVVFTNTSPKLFKGPFSSTVTSDDGHYQYSQDSNFNPDNQSSGNSISFIFTLDDLTFDSDNNDTIYYMLVVIDSDTENQGNIMDTLDRVYSIRIEEGEIEQGSDFGDSFAPPNSANITNWEVEIF